MRPSGVARALDGWVQLRRARPEPMAKPGRRAPDYRFAIVGLMRIRWRHTALPPLSFRRRDAMSITEDNARDVKPVAMSRVIRNPDDGFALLRLALSPLPLRLPLVAFVIFVIFGIFVIFARSGSGLCTAGDADVSTRIPYQSSMAA